MKYILALLFILLSSTAQSETDERFEKESKNDEGSNVIIIDNDSEDDSSYDDYEITPELPELPDNQKGA